MSNIELAILDEDNSSVENIEMMKRGEDTILYILKQDYKYDICAKCNGKYKRASDVGEDTVIDFFLDEANILYENRIIKGAIEDTVKYQ